MSPCWTGKYGGHPSHRRVFLFNHWFTDEILDVLFELMPLSSSPPTPDRNETPEVTNDVRTSGASDCRSFLCIKMRSSRCHSDLIMSKSTPSRHNPFVDRANCCDAPYGLHSLGVQKRIPTLAPGHIEAGIHQKPSPLLKQERCQRLALEDCGRESGEFCTSRIHLGQVKQE